MGGRITQTIWITRAQDGAIEDMPGVLAALAQRLRAGELDSGELEFIAQALEQIARHEDPAKEAARALLLVRPPGRATRAQAFDTAYRRAQRVRELSNEGGHSITEIFERVAEEESCDASRVSKAYYLLREALDDTDRIDQEERIYSE